MEKDRISYFVERPEYRPYYDITGEPVEFALKIYVGKTTIEILECVEKMLGEEGVQPAQFQVRTIFVNLQRYPFVEDHESKRVL